MFEIEEYKLIEYNGLGCKTKHWVECPYNHRHLTSYTNFNQGIRCRICAGCELITEHKLREV